MTATHNIADLNRAVALYQQLSGKTAEDVLTKQGGKLGREIFFSLLKIAPDTGAVRAEILQRLRSGKFIRIRPSVVEEITAKANQLKQTGKAARFLVSKREAAEQGAQFGRLVNGRIVRNRLGIQQEMVRREIAVRESGRRFLAVSARYPKTLQHGQKAISRSGLELSNVGIKTDTEHKSARFTWAGINRQSKEVTEALGRPVGKRAIIAAINTTRDDIMEYVKRKQLELVTKSVKKLVRQRN